MIKSYVYILLTVLVASIAAGCSGTADDEPEAASLGKDNRPLAMIIKQRSDSASAAVTNQLLRMFRYTRIPVTTYDTELLNSGLEIPESVRLLYMTSADTDAFTDGQVADIAAFVGRGHTLVITGPVFDERFNFLSGIRRGAPYAKAEGGRGFEFRETIFPGYTGGDFTRSAAPLHGGLADRLFGPDVEVIARSRDSLHVPVITRHRTGQGQTLFFNSNTAYDKIFRGLLFSLGLTALETVPYPVANVSTIFLDDFPLPMYDVLTPPINREYGLTEAQFISSIWWPDMKALADTFDIDYTAVLAFNYNANVVPPFDFREWEGSDVSIAGQPAAGSMGLARDVRDSRHELGFHGYNHFSLLRGEWPNQEFMITALQSARRRWKIDNLGPLPVTYVPPTNEIDSLGLAAVTRSLPSVEYMSSLYLGDRRSGGGREFGPDPIFPELYDYPRITSGFLLNDQKIFTLHGVYLLTGIWTHFVHPDDVFQVKTRVEDPFASRNVLGLGWRNSPNYDYGLFDVFKQHLQTMRETYPLMRYRTVQDAVPELRQWQGLQLKRSQTPRHTYTYGYGRGDDPQTWFMYVDSTHADTLAGYLREQAQAVHTTPVWKGALVQFTSARDSLVFPRFGAGERDAGELQQQVRQAFYTYLQRPAGNTGRATSSSQQPWRDTRLEEARRALQRHPSSRPLQERVIALAVEQERISLALDILEQRLLNDGQWHTDDVERLLRYYGWAGAYGRAYDFLDRLWQKYPRPSVITLKQMMVQQYGRPDRSSFAETWLRRELSVSTTKDAVRRRLVLDLASPGDWPRAKAHLDTLIASNPRSDTLYHYALQHSFYYDEPEQTLTMLESFPDEYWRQLRPLAAQIADLYAYTAQDYTRALKWAARAPCYPLRPQLDWLLQQKRYPRFIARADSALDQGSAEPALRNYVGRQLIYNGYEQEGYERLYPLFERQQTDSTTRQLVHSEIGYQSYPKKKVFFRTYPAFFSDSLRQLLHRQYRQQEGVKVGVSASYASDNYANTTARSSVFAEWGNRQDVVHRVGLRDLYVASDGASGGARRILYGMNYTYRRLWPDRGLQGTGGVGFYADAGTLFPEASLGAGYGRDSTYTSLQLGYTPELTGHAVRQDIRELSLSLYHENYWHHGRIQTTLSAVGKRYSNSVYAGEVLGRGYLSLPGLRGKHGLRLLSELSYSDASRYFDNADPFFTPQNLFIKGAGMQYRYRGGAGAPSGGLSLEVMGKHDNENGLYLTSALQLNARIRQYWQLSLDASLSSSAVYRYNQVGLSVSYLLPNHL